MNRNRFIINKGPIKEITIGFTGTTKVGKTTLVTSLSENYKISEFFNSFRTRITTVYRAEKNGEKINVLKIEINPVKIFGRDGKSSGTNFNKRLKEKLQDFMSFFDVTEVDTNATEEEIEKHVETCINKKIDTLTNEDEIKKFLTNEIAQTYISKIIIQIPVEEKFMTWVKDKAGLQEEFIINLVDTRGLLDLEENKNTLPEDISDAKDLEARGLTGLDALIFLTRDETFPEVINALYKNMLSAVGNAIPIFIFKIMDMDDVLIDYENIQMLSFEDCEQIDKDFFKREDETKCKRKIAKSFFEIMNMLRTVGLMKADTASSICFNYTTHIFKVEDTVFSLPKIRSLQLKNNENNNEFLCYQSMAWWAIANVVDKTVQYMRLMNSIDNTDFKTSLREEFSKSSTKYDMYPSSIDKNYRDEINELIKQKTDDTILGPLNGVTTRSNGSLLYAPELACGISALMWLYNFAKNINICIKEELKFDNGSKIAPDIVLKNQNDIIMKYIFKKAYDFTDRNAYFSTYTFAKRLIIKEAILRYNDVANPQNYNPKQDALYNVVQNIIQRIFE